MGEVRGMPPADGGSVRSWAHRWRWVLLYSLLLFGTLNYTRRFLDWLEGVGLAGLLSMTLLLVVVGLVVFLLVRLRQVEGRLRAWTLARLAIFLLFYLACVVLGTTVTVERVHFLQYGILGVLGLSAASCSHRGWRRVAVAMLAVFVVGLADEVVQGMLAIRYFDVRDVCINLAAGGLPVVGMAWLPLRRAGRPCEGGHAGDVPWRGDPVPGRTGAPTLADLWILLAFVGLGLITWWIEDLTWDPAPLVGTWVRENPCGETERLTVRPDGTVLRSDTGGGRAEGTFEIGGNRLDGILFSVQVERGVGEDDCVWPTGHLRGYYFEVEGDRLVFKKQPEHPFERLAPP